MDSVVWAPIAISGDFAADVAALACVGSLHRHPSSKAANDICLSDHSAFAP